MKNIAQQKLISPNECVRNVLERTGGVLHKKNSEKDILKWQRKTRSQWE